MTMTIVEFLHKNICSRYCLHGYTQGVSFVVSPILPTSARCGCAQGTGFGFDNAAVLKDTKYRHSVVISTEFATVIKTL